MDRIKAQSGIPLIPEGIAFRIIEGEAVIINPKNGMIYVLNQTGASAWQKVDGEKSLKEISGILAGEYQVSQADTESDLSELFGELSDRGLIAWK